MKVDRKTALAAGGIAAALAVIVVLVAVAVRRGAPAPRAPATGEQVVCLKTDIPLIEGADKRCFTRSEIAALADRRVLDSQGAPAEVELSHPRDVARAPETAATCRRYESLAGEGWYALSSRDMRREAYFRRACGALAFLERARKPDVTYFEDGALSEADVDSLAGTSPFRIGPAVEPGARETTIEKDPDGTWRLISDGQIALLQEIAHADFDGDGRGDMLVFVAMRVEGATAAASMAGLLEKASAAGPVVFVAREEGPPRAF